MKQLTILFSLFLLVACQEKKFDRFERETREFTIRNCPKMVDQLTVLDSLVFHNDGSLNYIYYYSATLDEEQRQHFAEIHDDFWDSSLKGIRSSIELKQVKSAGLNIIYVYTDAETGKEIATYTFTKEDYQ